MKGTVTTLSIVQLQEDMPPPTSSSNFDSIGDCLCIEQAYEAVAMIMRNTMLHTCAMKPY